MFSKKALNLCSIILGIVFLISGVGKITNVADFSILISQYGFPGIKFLAPSIILLEILLGLALVLLINPKFNSLVSILLLTAFTSAFAYANFKHGITNCGCFGTLKLSQLPPVFTYLRNILLIAFSIIIWLKYPKEEPIKFNLKSTIVIFVMFVATFLAGFTYRSSLKFKRNIQKDVLIGKDINETKLAKYANTSKDSTYLIFCFSYTCPHCLNSIENLKQYEKTKTVDRLILIVSDSKKDREIFNENFQLDLPVISLPTDSLTQITELICSHFLLY